MGIYRRTDSPHWWMLLERPGQKPIRRSTGIPTNGRSAVQLRQREQDAMEVYRCALADLARERVGLPRHKPPPAPPIPTFAAFLEGTYFAGLPRHTADGYRRQLGKLIKAWRSKPLDSITLADIYAYRKARLAAGIKPSSIENQFTILGAAFNMAAKLGHIKHSPLFDYIRLPRSKAPLRRLLTHDEEERLLRELSPEDRVIFLIGLDGLARLGSALSLRWEDDHGSYLMLYQTKNGSSYPIPVSTRLRAAMNTLPQTSARMFPRATRARGGVHSWKKTYCDRLHEAAKRAGIPWGREHGRTFHWSTRRTGASRMLQRGAEFKKVQKIGNWETLRVLFEIYAETLEEGIQDVVELVSQPNRRLRLVHSQSRKKTRS